MLSKRGIFSVAAIACMMIAASCTKDRTEDDNEKSDKGTPLGSTSAFYKDNALEEQSFIIDSVPGDTIYGKDGTKIFHIPKTLFMYKDNHQDIHYPFILKLKEAYSIKNMILGGYPNKGAEGILKSGGEIKLNAFKDNRELVLKQGRGLNVMMPANPKDPDMTLFYGFTDAQNYFWTDNVLQTTDYLYQVDSVTWVNKATYIKDYWFLIAKLGWLNCDAYYNYSNKTDIAFSLDTLFTNPGNLDLYIIFKNMHAFLKVSSFSISNMPVGEPVTVFALGSDGAKTNPQYYYFKQDYTISVGMNLYITLTAATEAEILAIMNSF